MGPRFRAGQRGRLPLPGGNERVPQPPASGRAGASTNARPRPTPRRPRASRGARRDRPAAPHAAAAESGGYRADVAPRLLQRGRGTDSRYPGVVRPSPRDTGARAAARDAGGRPMSRRYDFLDRLGASFPAPGRSFESFLRHLDRKRRRERLISIVVALLLAALVIGTSLRAIERGEELRPATPNITRSNVGADRDLESERPPGRDDPGRGRRARLRRIP